MSVCAVQHNVAGKGVNYMTFKYNVSAIGLMAFPEHWVSRYKRLCILIKGVCHYDTATLPALLSHSEI